MLNIAHEIVAWRPSHSCKEKRPELSMVHGNATFAGCRSNVVPIHPETPKAPNPDVRRSVQALLRSWPPLAIRNLGQLLV